MSRLLAWLLSALLGSMGLSHAQVGVNTLPMGGRVVVGSGSLQQGSNTLVITQATPKLGMDWQSFNIGSGALVEFVQPGADSVALNRVLGNSGSEIYGHLRANGQVFLVNPSGILFAPGSKVDVGGLVASTLDLSQQDFANGRYNFNSTGSSGSVVNQGELRANAGGYLALFGNRVDNQGSIQVDSGSVVLASGRAATISISGSGLISAVVTAGDAGNVSNSGSILADGGVVTMTAQSAEGVASSLVNNSGIIRANTLVERNGEVWITGDNVANSGQISARSEGTAAGGRITLMANLQRGEAQVGGTLDASSAGGDGGFIETSGSRVKVADSARITTAAPGGRTGTWLIDPPDFTVAPSGGDMTGAVLSSQLASTNVTILSSAGSTGTLGDVNVADTVSWSANRLTLNAQNNISVTQAMTGTGTATLRLEFGQSAVATGNTSSYSITAPVSLPSGASFTTKQGSNGADVAYTVISTLADLQAIDATTTTRSGNWALGADIDGSGAASLNNGTGYKPIGSETTYSANNTTSFTGRLDGLGHAVNNLTINRATGNYTGLFASATGATFRNLTLSGESVTGSLYVGGLVGYAGSGTTLSYVSGLSGVISAFDDSSSGTYAGGLIGATPNTAGALVLNHVSTTGSVSTNTTTTSSHTGGVVAWQGGGSMTAVTSQAGVTATQRTGGAVTSFYSGGLAGRFDGTTVTDSTASGAVSGGSSVGGLIGWVNTGSVSNSSATGNVTGVGGGIGGLIGYYGSTTGSLSNLTASGSVTGGASGDVGGLVGVVVAGSGSLSNSSATGNVSGPSNANSTGGLVGDYRMTGGMTNVTAGTSGSTVSGGTYAGGVIGYASTSAAFNNNAIGSSPLRFVGASVSGNTWAGGVVGYSAGTSTWSNLSSSVPVTSAGSAGGLIGFSAGLVTGATSGASVTGGANGVIGGVVGQAAGGVAGSTASGPVGTSGSNAYVGGLVGSVTGGSVTNSAASGNVTDTGTSGGRVGGLVGSFSGTGSISNGTASGAVQGGTSTGGLVGLFSTSGAGGNISGSSATGDVSSTLANADVGGLVGLAQGSGTISNSFARGNVSGPSNASGTGGLVGQFQMSGGVSNSNAGASGTTVTGGAYTGGVVGYSTSNAAYVTDSNAGTAITFNGASVSGTTWVGGIVGYSTGTAGFTGLSASAPVTGTGSAGGVVGYAGGLVSGVTSSATVNGGNAYVGGVAGQAIAGVSNSQASGAVTASTAGSSVGGLVGYVSGGSISNSSATGNVRSNATSSSNVGGLIGYMGGTGTSITNSQASGTVDGGNNAGGLVGYFTIGGTTGGNIGNSSATGNVTTTLTGGDIGGLVGYASSVGSMSDSFARGTVTAPATADTVGGLVGEFRMSAGLVNSNAGAAASGNTAASTVSGGNYTGGVLGWSNVNTAFTTDSNAGTAITFNGASVSGNTWVGGLFGQSTGTSALTGLSSSATVTGTGSSSTAGGLAGYSAGNVSNSSASGAVSATNNVGGLIGQAAGTGAVLVSGSSASGRVSNTTTSGYVGGLIGYSSAAGISNSTATGNVSGGNYAGGLVGYFSNNNSITGSRADGTVSGSPNAGGLAGYTAGTGSLSSGIATGSVTGTANNTGSVGGLVGEYRMSGGLSGSRADGAVSVGYYVGGLVGYSSTIGTLGTSTVNQSSISGGVYVGGVIGYAASTGTIDGFTTSMSVSGGSVTNPQAVGGVAGFSAGPVINSHASGAISGNANTNVGGLVGWARGNVGNSTSSGTVTQTGNNASVGGLVGYMDGGSLSGSTASGSVASTGTDPSVGGLVGAFVSSGSITGSQATGNVSGGGNTGGLVGYFTTGSQISNVSATGTVQPLGTSPNAGGLIGYASGIASLQTASASGNVTTTATSGNVGGAVGQYALTGTLSGLSAGGDVSGGATTGGVIGYLNATSVPLNPTTVTLVLPNTGLRSITSSYWTGGYVGYSESTQPITGLSFNGNVTGLTTNGAAGGIAGRTNGPVNNNTSSGTVTGRNDMGGLVGQADGAGGFSGNTSSAAVVNLGTSGRVGGLVGDYTNSGALQGVSGVTTATGNVSGGDRTGGLVGYYNSAAGVSNVSASGNVSGNAYAGGLVGDFVGDFANHATLTNATASGNVTGQSYVGGMVGSYYLSGAATGLLATGNVTSSQDAGGLFGLWQYSGTLSDSQARGNVSGGSRVGGAIGYGYSNTLVSNVIASGTVRSTATNNTIYAGGLAGDLEYTNVTLATAQGAVTVVTNSTAYAGGLFGTYYNSNASSFVSSSSASGAVRVDASSAYVGGFAGQFGYAAISQASATGSVQATDSRNSGNSQYVGGLLGYLYGSQGVTDSSATSNVTSNYMGGGLIAYNDSTGTLVNVTASGNVVAGSFGGGLVGYSTGGGIQSGVASGNVQISGSGSYGGGLVGYMSLPNGASVSDSRASGNVSGAGTNGSGATYLGGLIGYLTDSNTTTQGATISNSSASGNVSSNYAAGGLVGYWSWGGSSTAANRATRSLSGSLATGQVTGGVYSGGAVGYMSSWGGIQVSAATGSVSANGYFSNEFYAGGLVGYFQDLGTLANASTGQISGSYATGAVGIGNSVTRSSSTNSYLGGLVGYARGPGTTGFVIIRDSYATGAVTQTGTVGRLHTAGLVAYSDRSIASSYATGLVTATTPNSFSNAGGLVAQTVAGTTGAGTFWATDATGQASSALGTGTTLASLRNASTFTGWDLSSNGGSAAVWRLYEGLSTPLLRSFLTPLTLSLVDVSKVYDGTSGLGNGAITIGNTGVLHPERILVGAIPADVGVYGLTNANLYSVHNGYDLSLSGAANLTITAKPLTFAGLVADKVYDGTRAATLVGTPQLGGLVAGEDLLFQPDGSFAGQFDTKNVGTSKAVTLSGGYTIADGARGKASNYLAPSTLTSSANITPATVTAGSFAAVNRVYDGSTTVAVSTTSGAVTGVLAGDQVSVDLSGVSSGTMADKNVGTAKQVTLNGIQLTGTDAGNYVVGGSATTTVDITQRAITVNGISAADRVYNANRNVSVNANSAVLSGAVTGDSVQLQTLSLSGTVADKNVANGKAVTVTGLGLRGLDAANYSVQQGAVAMNITPYLLTISLSRTTGSDRVYDGTTNATAVIPVTWYGGDNIVATATSMTFADKNVAYTSGGAVTSKAITASGITITGTDVANYSLQNTSAATTGTISPKALTVSGVSAVNRSYDGTRNITVNIAGATVDTTAVITGDVVGVATPGTGSVVGQVANKNVGSNKAVTVPGLSLTGADAGNYTITGSGSGVTVNITPKGLTAIYTGVNKVYDGVNYASVSVSSPDIVTGDVVAFYADQSYCSGCWTFYNDRNVGQNKAISISFNGLYSTDAANYTLLNTTGSTTANITPKPVTLLFSAPSKVYNGATDATVTLNTGGSGIYSVDQVTSTQDAVFTGTGAKNVGTSKPISVSNIVTGGTGVGNYTFNNTTATASGNVTAKPITVSGITGVDRSYDGTTAVAVVAGTVGSSGFVNGDNVSVTLPSGGLSTGTIANKNVGVAKPVTVTGLSLSGTDATNYSIDSTASGITVNITSAALTPTYTATDRVYNGSVSAQVTSTTTGVLAGDTVTFTQQAVYTGIGAKDVGVNKPISVTNITLSGASAANYTLASTTSSTTGGITPKPVNISFVGGSRVYNGLADVTANVVGTSLQFLAGDQVSTSQTAVFTGDGSVGTNKAVTISGITLSGSQAANYSLLNTTASSTASITPRSLGVTGITATSRVYDGTTAVAVNLNNATVDTSGVVAGDDVTPVLPSGGSTTGSVADRNVGNGKAVTVTGITLTGAQASNYALVGATGLTVNVTPKSVTAVYAAAGKVYDGSADANVSGTSADFLSVDSGIVSVSAQGLFTAGKNVGSNKDVAVSGGFLAGSARDNYLLINDSGSSSASITPRTLTVSYSGGSRVYDGGITAPVSATLGNRVTGDLVGVAQSAEFTGTNARSVGINKPVAVSGMFLTGADAGNYTLGASTASTTGSITAKPITVGGLSNVTALDRIYDATAVVQVSVPSGVTLTPNSNDIVAGDTVTIDVPGSGLTTGTMVDKNVGTGKAVSVTGLTLSGADAGNYSIAGTAGITVTITPLTITALWAGVNKVYDGTAAATATGSSAGVLAGDSLLIRGSGLFTGTGAKNVGTAKDVIISSASLSGSDARNYSLLNTTGSTTADITPRNITPSYSGGTRVYDGSTAAPVTSTSPGFVAGDTVSLSQTAVFTGSGARNAGTNKAVAVSGISLAGADAANYALTATSTTTTATITPKPLVLLGLSGLSAVNRSYDGTRNVSVAISSTGSIAIDSADLVAGDVVSVVAPSGTSTTGTVANKNAGIGKAVTVTGLTLNGADAANYSIAATSGLTANITPLAITASWVAVNRVYDGSTTAQVTGTSAAAIAGDVLSFSAAGTFSDSKNVGTAKPVTISAGQLGGGDAANYTLLNTTGSGSANVTPRSATANYVGGTKVYDGTLSAPVTGTLGNLVSGDAVTLGQTAVFTGDKNVGNGKAVTVSGIALSGADAVNYSLTAGTASTTASITPRPLHLIGLTGVTAADRTYDGTRDVTVTVATSGTVSADPNDLVAGDLVTVTAPPAGVTTGTMADKNVGTNKAVAVTGLTLGGADAPNYSVSATTGVTVNIAPRQLTATYSGVDRVYDGTVAAAVLMSAAGAVTGDSLSLTASGTFTDGKNAGSAKPIAVSNGTLGGADAANYTLLNTSGSTTASVTPRTLTASYVGASKVYDGTAAANVTRTLTGLLAGDTLAVSESAVFAGGTTARNVGSNKAITVSAITLSGTDAVNYALISSTASTVGSITPRPLTVSGLSGITAIDRVYDGSTAVSLNMPGSLGSATGDALPGDQVSVAIAGGGIGSGTMLDKNAGQNKSVVLSGLSLTGADAGNYFIAGTTGLTVNISPKALQALFSGVNRVYDGSTGATVLGGSADIVSGDSVSIAGTGQFTGTGARNVGTGKAVSITGASLSGADAGNYTLTGTTGQTTADITPRTLTATWAGGTREYNGGLDAPVTGTLVNLVAGDQAQVSDTAQFTDSKNVGTNKPVSITGIALSGADAGNYLLSGGTSASATATVTQRALTVSGLTGITAQDRVYDGTTAVAVNIPGTLGSATGDIIAGDSVTVTLPGSGISSASMLDKNAGQNKAVVLNGLTLSGADAGNYRVAGTLGLTVNIAQRPLSISGVAATDRVYDGTTTVAIDTTAGTLAGAVTGDNVQLLTSGVTGAVADKHVGSAKAVTVTGLALSGTDLVNYSVTSGPGLTVNITPRALAPTMAAADKVYDGTTGATVTLADNRISGDILTLSAGNASYASSHAGTGIAVTVSGLALAGTDAGDYQLSATQLSGTGNITRRAVTITPNAVDKVYGNALTLLGTAFTSGAQDLVTGETIGSVTLTSAGTTAAAAVQGSPYSITAGNATGGSFDASNYTLTYGSGLLTVRPRAVTVAANSRVLFAGDTLPALNSYGFSTSVDGLYGTDALSTVTISPQGLTGTQAVGGIYTLQASNAAFNIGNASNYALSYASGVLLVLPQQPRVGDTSGGGGGGSGFAVTVTPQERADALDALLQALLATSGTGNLRNRTPTTAAPLVNALQSLTPDDLALLLSGDSRKLNVPDLLKLPLFSFDPELRRLMQAPETTPSN